MKDTVLYDGDCRFCTASIAWLKWLDWGRSLHFRSLHDPTVSRDFPDLTHEQLMQEMWVATGDGQRYAGADALRYLTRRLPSLYPWMPILHIPFSQPLWRKLYGMVARYRYRIAGRHCSNGTCHLHRH